MRCSGGSGEGSCDGMSPCVPSGARLGFTSLWAALEEFLPCQGELQVAPSSCPFIGQKKKSQKIREKCLRTCSIQSQQASAKATRDSPKNRENSCLESPWLEKICSLNEYLACLRAPAEGGAAGRKELIHLGSKLALPPRLGW